MNFKKKLATTFSQTQGKERNELKERILEMERSGDEWKIVKEYIGSRILEKTAQPYSAKSYLQEGLRGKWICLWTKEIERPYLYYENKDRNKAVFCKEFNIIINWKDIERFCKENKLKLRYGINSSYGPDETRLIKHNPYNLVVYYYLIKVS
ncbi:MAG: hypothetical protein IJ215_05490 [Clostridia bacterium]|nr:hypothetical protein [Clostridia bacterium]